MLNDVMKHVWPKHISDFVRKCVRAEVGYRDALTSKNVDTPEKWFFQSPTVPFRKKLLFSSV